ncbi:MAG: TolC family protein [Bacteroidales bacterium]|nr:TolC family protein [Bacteroidales bacterium]MDD3152503.1 TolC family protein [Bacteroidales bacterium]MDD3914287.1 TolC family protein [Bacteroidales bacterium]MDD4634350.1 TolC family protein [Bacteroidales bacterium]
MKYIKLALIAIIAFSLSSCGIYKNYSRPADLKTFGVYSDSTLVAADSTRISWQDIFLDPTLKSLIQKGLDNNTDLRIAQLQSEEAEASLRASKWAFAPSFSFSPQGTMSGTIGSSTNYTYELPVSASWQIDIFGSLRNAKKRSQVQLESSKEYAQAVQTQLIGNIATYYYKLVLLDKQLAVYQETAENWRANVEVTKRLMAAGQYNDAAVAQSEANYYSICSSVMDIEQQIKETENTVIQLLGDTLQTIARDTTFSAGISDFFSNGISLNVLALRPDVMQAEQTFAAYFYAVGEAKSAFYPSLTLGGTLGWSNSSGGLVLNPASWIWSALGSLTQPIFQQGKLRSQLKIAEAQQEEAKLSFQQTLLNAGIEVNNALSQVQSYGNRGVYYEQQVLSLKRAVTSTTALMKHGSNTYLEVLTAQQSLLSAQLTQLNNDYNKTVSVINLFKAL